MNQGVWQKEQCSICKNLFEIFQSLNNLMTKTLFGNVFFSLLPKNSKISEHCGMTNARLRVHFGIKVPTEQKFCYMLVDKNVIKYFFYFCYFKINFKHFKSNSKKEAKFFIT